MESTPYGLEVSVCFRGRLLGDAMVYIPLSDTGLFRDIGCTLTTN